MTSLVMWYTWIHALKYRLIIHVDDVLSAEMKIKFCVYSRASEYAWFIKRNLEFKYIRQSLINILELSYY